MLLLLLLSLPPNTGAQGNGPDPSIPPPPPFTPHWNPPPENRNNVCYPTEKGGEICFENPVGRPNYTCKDLDDLWKSWRKGTFLKGYYSTIFFAHLKENCPKGAGSIDYLATKFKAHEENEKKARKEIQKAVEPIYHRNPCPPGMWGLVC
jgi:hypothetical protein